MPPTVGTAALEGISPAIDRIGNRDILVTMLKGLAGRARLEPGSVRRQLMKSLWIELKRFSAPNIRDIEVSELIGIDAVTVRGTVARHCPLVLAALAQALECQTIFEIGTYRGDTSWLLAHNRPTARIFTLDLPGLEAARSPKLELTDPEYFTDWKRGERFLGTPESSRITQLYGDSATFDFSPYHGSIDLVYIDGSHSYSYVRSDSQAALKLLSPKGTIVWDDYTYYPGIYAYLNQLSPQLSSLIMHIRGTRLAIYSRCPIRKPAP